MNTAIYKIEALTNLHVGSGDANFGVIDNQVQRDVTTGLPTINGSSLKGALKEFFKAQNFNKLNEVFGSSENNANYRFLAGNLLAIPMRSNKKPYFLATCPQVIKQLKEDAKNFDYTVDLSAFDNLFPEVNEPIIFDNFTGLLIENFDSFETETIEPTKTIFGEPKDLVILNDEDFIELCNDFNLPVIPRNKVATEEDSNSNLWHEQVVPSKSLFYFTLIHNGENLDEFKTTLESEPIHIGANATVGYGFTNISKL